jgi:hypothetical protein
MDAVVPQRALVQRRQVPDVEVRGPERQCDERMPEHTQPLDRLHGEHGPKQRPGQAGDESQRGQVAQQHVLDHVEGESPLSQLLERRRERNGDEQQAEREHDDAPPRHRRAARGERAGPAGVRRTDQDERKQLEDEPHAGESRA